MKIKNDDSESGKNAAPIEKKGALQGRKIEVHKLHPVWRRVLNFFRFFLGLKPLESARVTFINSDDAQTETITSAAAASGIISEGTTPFEERYRQIESSLEGLSEKSFDSFAEKIVRLRAAYPDRKGYIDALAVRGCERFEKEAIQKAEEAVVHYLEGTEFAKLSAEGGTFAKRYHALAAKRKELVERNALLVAIRRDELQLEQKRIATTGRLEERKKEMQTLEKEVGALEEEIEERMQLPKKSPYERLDHIRFNLLSALLKKSSLDGSREEKFNALQERFQAALSKRDAHFDAFRNALEEGALEKGRLLQEEGQRAESKVAESYQQLLALVHGTKKLPKKELNEATKEAEKHYRVYLELGRRRAEVRALRTTTLVPKREALKEKREDVEQLRAQIGALEEELAALHEKSALLERPLSVEEERLFNCLNLDMLYREALEGAPMKKWEEAYTAFRLQCGVSIEAAREAYRKRAREILG